MARSSVSPPAAAQSRIFSPSFVCLFVSVTLGWIGAYFLYPVLPLYVRNLGGGDIAVGVMGLSFGVASIVGRLISSSASEAWGRRRLLVYGSATATIALALCEVTPNIASLVLVRVLHGIATAFITTTGAVIAADLVPARRRAEGIGYYQTSSNIAAAVGPSLAFLLMGVTWLPLRSFSLVFAGGIVAYAVGTLFAWQVPETGSRAAIGWGWIRTFKIGNFLCLPAVVPALVFSSTFAFATVSSFLPLASADRGDNVASFFLAFGSLSVISRLLLGRISDRLGPVKTVVPVFLCAIPGLILLTIDPIGPIMVAGGILLGIGLGGSWPIMMALALDIVTAEQRPALIAAMYVAVDVGTMAGSFISGVVASFAGYGAAFLGGASVVAVALIAFVVYARQLRFPERIA